MFILLLVVLILVALAALAVVGAIVMGTHHRNVLMREKLKEQLEKFNLKKKTAQPQDK